MKKNLHSHTQFCDGRSTMEEIIRSAYEAGFTEWGFTPHAPINVESPCNMKRENVKDYLGEIQRLRRMFPDIKILAGMEIDFIDENNSPASPYVKDYGIDYVIGSVHFIPNQKGIFYDIDGSPDRFKRILNEFFEGDLNYVVTTFWKQTQRMIEAGGLNIVGHIDKIALNASFVNPEIENTPEYLKMAWETIEMAINKGLSIEINTKHWEKYRRFFPHPRFWKHILEKGIEMPVNTDTHYAECVESGRNEAIKELGNLKGIN